MSSNQKLTIVETFVGCGGSHLGFKDDFKPVFVNDIWKTSLDTLRQNNKELKEHQIIEKDINELCKEDVCKEYKIKQNKLDLLMGGVVCKGFSLAGVRNPYDERNYLYISQLKLVEKFKPKVSIIENVPGMLNMKILIKKDIGPISKKLKEQFKDSYEDNLEELCKEIHTTIENHKSNRGQIIAIKKKIGNEKDKNNKALFVKELDELEKTKKKLDSLRKEQDKNLDKYKYSVIEDIENRYKELGYKVDRNKLMCSEYGGFTNRQRLIIVAKREDITKEWIWPDKTNSDKDEKLENLKTVRDAFNLLDKKKNDKKNDKDNIPMNHKKTTVEKFKLITSGSKNNGFSSRGTTKRLSYDKPSPTLVPGHSSFHIHPTEHRSITVREGALITGFPNDFIFCGSHTDRCMQIGNAIPIHLAKALSKSVVNVLT